MFRELIPRLADRYRVIAPDLPGFGFTEVPEKRKYRYSFEALARTLEAFTDALSLNRHAIYVFDYGAPTGFRLAMGHPERVTPIISQNGNAYEEGLGDAWGPIRRYWSSPTAENREVLRQNILTLEATRWQYTHGIANPERFAPESYTLDAALMGRPGNKEIQLDLFLDYASNVKLYPKFQEYFRNAKPPLLAIWGKNDPFFIPAGADGISKGSTDCAGPASGYGSFCNRDARRGNRRCNERVSWGLRMTKVLFEAFTLKSLELKNRIAMAPMTRGMSSNGIPGRNVAAYYRARAEGPRCSRRTAQSLGLE
jgi:pimeloyl-ACP methyl ester carboxylesterase